MKKNKLIYIFIAILIAILLISTFTISRKIFIIRDLNNKVSTYNDSTNMYIKSYSTSEKDVSEYNEYFLFNQILRERTKRKNEETYIDVFYNDNKIKTYINSPNAKTLSIRDYNDENSKNIKIIPNFCKYNNFKELFLNSVFTKIKKTKYNGKDTYILSGIKNSNLIYEIGIDKIDIYIEKDTGLTLKIKQYKDNNINDETNYEYSFGTVDSNDVKEPYQEEYVLK